MKRLLLLAALLGCALAMPQGGEDAFLESLLGGGDPAAPGAGGDPAAPISETDQSFVDSLLGTIDNVGPVEVTRCERGEFTCTPYFRCAEANIVADGLGQFDVRFGITKETFEADHPFITHSECTRYGDVCCTDPLPEITGPTEPLVKYQPECGRRNGDGIEVRITGFEADQSQFGELPYMAAVLRVEDIGGEQRNFFECAGSLIAPHVVMTAAHCVHHLDAKAKLRVRLGEWDTQKETEPLLHVDIDVASRVSHPEFEPKSLRDDVALLFLKESATLAPHIDTLCLPDPTLPMNSYTNCTVGGWGKDNFNVTGQFQTILKLIELKHVPNDKCQQKLRLTRLRKYFRLDRSFTCAGGEVVAGKVKDACTGDGGAPLACRDPNNPSRYVQVGIVSWGIGCATANVPGVYAGVPQQVGWIDQQIRAHPAPPPSPPTAILK